MTVSSTFDTNAEGWVVDNGTTMHFTTGGNPGGTVGGEEGGSGVWYYLAPAAYLGDQEAYYGGTISFDLLQFSTVSQFDDPDVTLTGGGQTIVIDAGNNPGTDWTSYSVDLELGGGWRIGSLSGSIASEAVIRAVLADLTSFGIRGEFVNGSTDDASRLDNVALVEGTFTPPPINTSVISSTFDTDVDGWSFIADVRAFNQVATGGNPGGYLEAVDFATGEIWYYVAPAKFLGDKAAFYGGTFSYDLKQSSLSGQFDQDDLEFTGGGITIALDLPHPDTDWTSYSIKLDETQDWRVGNEDGPVATAAEIQTVLGNLESIHIRGEYISGSDTGGLDNVVMEAALNVLLFQASAPLTALGYLTLEDAIMNAEPGSSITVQTPSLPRSTTGNIMVNVDDLTITAPTGYAETLQLSAPNLTLTLLGTSNIDVIGSAANDTVVGSSGMNILSGGSSSDSLDGGSNNDNLVGGNGNDTLLGGSGNDTLLGGAQMDHLQGGDGGDELRGNDGADTMEGGNGLDTMYGGAGDDVMNGGVAADTLYGNGGRDTMDGGVANDVIYGGNGNDSILGGGGNDTINGAAQNDFINGETGSDQIVSGNGNDTVLGSGGNDFITGGQGSDELRGGDNNDTLVGNLGNDTLFGGTGNDSLLAGDSNDTIYGNQGADTIDGGAGADVLFGGFDGDTFRFNNAVQIGGSGTPSDVIMDFQQGLDVIDLSLVDALTTVAGNQVFTFVGTAAHSGAGATLRYASNGTDTFVYGDIDADGAGEFGLRLDGVFTLSAGDFIL